MFDSREKNSARALSPPMLKIGQNWGKIANYPSNAQPKSAALFLIVFELRDCAQNC